MIKHRPMEKEMIREREKMSGHKNIISKQELKDITGGGISHQDEKGTGVEGGIEYCYLCKTFHVKGQHIGKF